MPRRWTHRRYLTGLAWLRQQLNEPDRTDHYLMQIAAALTGKEGSTLNDYYIKFTIGQPAKLSPEFVSKVARGVWGVRLGMSSEDMGYTPLEESGDSSTVEEAGL